MECDRKLAFVPAGRKELGAISTVDLRGRREKGVGRVGRVNFRLWVGEYAAI